MRGIIDGTTLYDAFDCHSHDDFIIIIVRDETKPHGGFHLCSINAAAQFIEDACLRSEIEKDVWEDFEIPPEQHGRKYAMPSKVAMEMLGMVKAQDCENLIVTLDNYGVFTLINNKDRKHLAYKMISNDVKSLEIEDYSELWER